MLTNKQHILYPRLFTIMEFFFLFINAIPALALTLSRFILLEVFVGVIFIRMDICPLPAEMQHMDPAFSSYISVLMLELQYHHPGRLPLLPREVHPVTPDYVCVRSQVSVSAYPPTAH